MEKKLANALANSNNSFTVPFGNKQITNRLVRKEITADYTLTDTDYLIEVGAIVAPITITVPSSVISIDGFNFLIIDKGLTSETNSITIATEGSELVSGFSSFPISDNGAHAGFYSDGLNLYISNGYEQPSFVYAYLTASTPTTVTTSGTYYPVLGTFANTPIKGFSVTSTPSLKHECLCGSYFEIDILCNVACNVANTTPKISVKKNSTVITTPAMGTFCEDAGRAYHLTSSMVLFLDYEDEIQLVCTSDGDGDILTFSDFIATIRKA